jgi:DNA-binding CsgD family transcriptional regulator
LNTRTAPELIPDERIRRLRDAITADPGTPVRAGILAPGGYGKTALLADLAAIYRNAGVRVASGPEELDEPGVLLVDDAHLLDSATLRRIRERAAADRARVIMAARPWPVPDGLRELAGALDGTAALRPFDRAQVGAYLAASGVPGRPGLEEFVLAQTGGVPAFVERLARGLDPSTEDSALTVPATAAAELGAEVEALPAPVVGFLLAADQLGGVLHVDLLGDLLECDREAVGEIAKAALATGMTDQGGRLIPIVRLTIRTVIPVDRRTAMRQRLADAQLARGPAWAERVSLAGDLDTALRVADQVLASPEAPQHGAAARVAAAALAHRGQLGSSAELFRWAGTGLTNAFAVIGLIGTGAFAAAEELLGESISDGPPTLLSGAAALMARGVHASVSGAPAEALTGLVRAASLLEPADPGMLLPDSPAALAAIVAVQCGELDVADSVLQRAVRAGMGGAPFAVRHRLLRAWVCLTRGDLSAARERLQNAGAARAAGGPLPPRDWLFAMALEVGLARRTSDLNALRRLWARAGDAVIRHPVDLYTLLPLGELAVAAARLGDSERLAAHLDSARSLLDALGNPPLWAVGLHWNGVHAAIVAEEWDVAQAHAAALSAIPGELGRYPAVLAAAARSWLSVVRGEVDPEAVEGVARDLHAAGLRWDAARLAGQAAIRTADRKAMVGLMECARVLQGESAALDRDTSSEPRAGGQLSERERQVARLVLAGLTYREVGDRLFISAKTVEHHIARMRQRLGSTSRRELLAQLRELLGQAG